MAQYHPQELEDFCKIDIYYNNYLNEVISRNKASESNPEKCITQMLLAELEKLT